MANLTLSIDDELLKRARVKAVQEGTSVNEIVRRYIERYADDRRERRARGRLVELAESSPASSGPGGREWTREQLYKERMDRYKGGQ